MGWAERIQNVLFGLNFIAWSLYPFVWEGSDALTPAAFSLAAINLIVGVLFLLRTSEVVGGSLRSLLICVPSIITYAVAFRLATPTSDWSLAANIVVVCGSVWTVVSFAFLGRCFAIFPAFRNVVQGGPYRLIRHPAYLGELVLLAACLVASPTLALAGLVLLTIVFLVIRILDEEQLLMQQAKYRQYAETVRWRLLPFVW